MTWREISGRPCKEGKEEMKKVLRVMAEVPPVDKEAPTPLATGTMLKFVSLMNGLETVSGRHAFVQAALTQVPGQQRAEWALRREAGGSLRTSNRPTLNRRTVSARLYERSP